MIKLSELYFGTVISNEQGEEFFFINHCFCKNNDDPDITIKSKEGINTEMRLSEIQTWKIQTK